MIWKEVKQMRNFNLKCLSQLAIVSFEKIENSICCFLLPAHYMNEYQVMNLANHSWNSHKPDAVKVRLLWWWWRYWDGNIKFSAAPYLYESDEFVLRLWNVTLLKYDQNFETLTASKWILRPLVIQEAFCSYVDRLLSLSACLPVSAQHIHFYPPY